MEAPPDAYSQRAEDEEKEEALESWSKRLKIVCFLQLIAVALQVYSPYWYASGIGFIMVGLGGYGAFKLKAQYVFVYLFMLLIDFVKDIIILYLSIHNGHDDGYGVIVILMLLVDVIMLLPVGAYHAFFFYRTLNLSADFEKLPP